MGKGRRFTRGNKSYRSSEPVISKMTLPHDEAVVLQHNPLPLLERGGVYTEMGADLTYEELNANFNDSLTTYGEQHQRINQVIGWYVGILALVVSIIALFVWPFWTGLSGLALSYVSFRQGTNRLAWISVTLSSIAVIMSIFAYFNSL